MGFQRLRAVIHGRPLQGSQPLPDPEPSPTGDVAGGTGQERAGPPAWGLSGSPGGDHRDEAPELVILATLGARRR